MMPAELRVMMDDDTAEKADEEERQEKELQREIDSRVAKATKKKGMTKEEVKEAQ